MYIGHKQGIYRLCDTLLSLMIFTAAISGLSVGQFICGTGFYQRDKLKRMIQTVSEKEPKVQSTTIKQMRRKATELLKKHSEISSEASRRAQ